MGKRSFLFGKCNDYLKREYRKGEIPLWEVPDIRKDEDIVYSPNKYRETEGIKDTNDPSALFCGFIDQASKTIWVFDEMYKSGMSNEAIAEEVQRMGYLKEKITADSAEPKSIDRLWELGLKGIRKARKGKDSINNGIDFIQDYHIIVHPRCVNFITEISNYTWDTDPKTGKKLNRPIDDFNHLMDAMRYAVESIIKGEAFSFE